jgi:hypothetical protein
MRRVFLRGSVARAEPHAGPSKEDSMGAITAFSLAVLAQAPAAAQAETWESLSQEYNLALERWARDSMHSARSADSAPSPAEAYRVRFAALAERGEGRAVVWWIENKTASESGRILDLVERAGEAEAVGAALFGLGARHASFDRDRLRAYLDARIEAGRDDSLRAFAAQARAQVLAEENPARAADLCLWGAGPLPSRARARARHGAGARRAGGAERGRRGGRRRGDLPPPRGVDGDKGEEGADHGTSSATSASMPRSTTNGVASGGETRLESLGYVIRIQYVPLGTAAIR